MDTPERPESPPESPSYQPPASLPAPASPWQAPAPMQAPAAPAWEEPYVAEAEAPSRPFKPKLIWQAFRRHWWQILLLWAAGTATLVTLVYYKVKPTYQAIAVLRVEPSARALTAPSYARGESAALMKTQTILVTTPDVLNAALQDPQVQNTSLVRNAIEAEADLRAALAVSIVEDSNLFTVAMNSENPAEGATIVNAVVKAYKDASDVWSSQEFQAQVERLKELEKEYRQTLTKHQNELKILLSKEGGSEAVQSLKQEVLAGGEAPVSYQDFARFAEEHTKAEMAVLTDETQLAYLKGALESRKAQIQAEAARRSAEDLEAEVKEIFLSTPDVARLVAEIEDAETQLEKIKRPMRNFQNDPAYRHMAREVEQLRDRYNDYWGQLYPRIRAQIGAMSAEDRQDLQGLEDQIDQMKLKINQGKTQEKQLRARLEELEVEQRNVSDLAFEIEMTRAAMNNSRGLLDVVEKNLTQLEYERRGGATIHVAAGAKKSGQIASNNRAKLFAAAPVMMLGLVLGLFTLLELRAARVADPDDLPSRVRLGVLGVVPPLPAPSGGRALRRGDDRRRVEEFVQSLDHLRVALYANRPDGTRRRCILITSAVGGEGKTTLAAQLAGRCANAGLLTVLVDADLRRPSLGDLLEVPEGPGLSDVLAGDADPEAAMVVIGNAGGFHLLPAGAPGRDPSRLLHGERLGELIAQLRATFDVVIIDAPPVLAVPDALMLGRWTDGAVLAVRHDSSRFPLVERANRRLAAVSIPVLGAVVNGCRTMETNYGAYQYTAYSGRGGDGA